ncbi:MAG TPA: tetratricopeptide repeat protein [Pyrinomonadaceae bacterium]|nr:tetratricopeptide repeat protein [Pyrinomonadaceae bacterium]
MTLSIALCLALSGCGRSAKYLAKGEEYLAKRKYHDALMQFRSAAETNDSSARAHWGLARTYEALGQFNDVLDELRKTVELDDENLDAKAKLGTYYLLVKPPMVTEAENLRDQIVLNHPNFIEGQILTASIMAAKGQPDDEVIAQVNKAVAMEPQRIASYVALQRLYMTRDRTADAEATINRGIEANPRASQGYTEYGRFLMYAERNPEAEAQFQKAIAIDGSDVEAREAIAEFYFNTRQLPKAEQAYIELVQMQNNSPESRLELADFYNKADRKDQAIASLEQILADSPGYVLARYKLTQIYIDRREPGKATEQLDALFKVNDDDVEALVLRARLNMQQNKPDEAVKDVEEVLKKYPSDRDSLFLMAQARLAMGQTDHANAFIADLERYHPTYLKTGLLKIQSAFTSSDSQAALRLSNELLDKANATQPDSDQDPDAIQEVRIRAITSRGLAMLDLGNLTGAKIELDNVVKMSPRSSAAVVNLAKVSVAEGDNARAAELYDKALAMDAQNFDAMSGVVASCIKMHDLAKGHQRVNDLINANAGRADTLAALHYLSSMIFDAEKNDAASEKDLQTAIDLDAAYLPAYTAYAGLLAKQDRVDEAAAQYNKAIAIKPSAEVYTLLGVLEDGRGNAGAAEAAYRHALEITPEIPIAANNLAWLIAENGGNLDEALQLATLATAKNPQNAVFFDTLGWVYLKKGLNSPAVEQLRKAVTLDETAAKRNGIAPSAGYRVRLGMALAKYGDKESARREVQIGLKNVSLLTTREQADARNVLASL